MLVLMLPSCIVPYDPHIPSQNLNKYVVSGQVNNNSEFQLVSVSMASPVDNPKYIPVSGCYVRIFDEKGNEYELQESDPGIYQVKIDKSYLIPGTSFRVQILTSDGIDIESDFDQMSECPEIDSVYFVRKEIQSTLPGQITRGLQFYIDLDAGNMNSHFFSWEAIETWEHHAKYPKQWWWNGSVHEIIPPDSSKMVCWSTELVKKIFTLSTTGLVENRYTMLPLQFVDNHSARLMYGYSLFINQFAQSEAAYSYWDQLRINSNEQGGLYEKQPLSIVGNLHNYTNPDQVVLGFFGVSSVKSRRIFISNVDDLPFDFTDYCSPAPLGFFGFREILPDEYPAYLLGDNTGPYAVVLSQYCIDCTALGGTTTKPNFWPE